MVGGRHETSCPSCLRSSRRSRPSHRRRSSGAPCATSPFSDFRQAASAGILPADRSRRAGPGGGPLAGDAIFERALVSDAEGRPISQPGKTSSQDWDEVNDFCRRVYMPYRVRPLGHNLAPDATMRRARVGGIIVTRFAYGVPIHLDEFDPAAGNILVLNTLSGMLRHKVDNGSDAVTGPGDSFVVDCSRTDYWLDGDKDHLQLNLTIPHDLIAGVARRWFGFVPDDRLWTRRLAFGGEGSRWQALLRYVVQSIRSDRGAASAGAMQRHLEEMICLDLLDAWAAGAGVRLADGARRVMSGSKPMNSMRVMRSPAIALAVISSGASA
ncbi:AraC family transcriptional regulator [Amaricoccus sp. HAR-UPW-R2A-40]|nr:AraC family transcriptional regulator [Amaricoccus sp. HAR-UPW-R2A-40]